MKMIKHVTFLYLLAFLTMPALALSPEEVSEEKYLIDHGHSDEIIRMIELQKSRIEIGNPYKEKFQKESRIKKFWKNLVRERDLTLPTEQFGMDRTQTVERPDR